MLSNSSTTVNLDIQAKKIAVMKFGGSCFKNAEAFQQIVKITNLYDQEKKIYVASALHGVTDQLIQVTEYASSKNTRKLEEILESIKQRHLSTIQMIFKSNLEHQLEAYNGIKNYLAELSKVLNEVNEFGIIPYFIDYIVAFGEKMSTFLLHLYLKMNGFPTSLFMGEDLIITNDEFNNAFPDLRFTIHRVNQNLLPILNDANTNRIACITGFIGRNKIGYTTTLGRGGSDFTATIIARAIYACNQEHKIKVILWKDVDGMLSANPEFVDNPTLVKKLNYAEAKELAFFGAKVLHPKCLAVIENQNIPVEIRRFSSPSKKEDFSTISELSDNTDMKGIGSIKIASMITLSSAVMVKESGFVGKIFSILGKNNININFIAQSSSEIAITFVVDKNDGERALNLLTTSKDLPIKWMDVKKDDIGIIAVVGEHIHKSSNKCRIFRALSEIDLDAISISQCSNGLNISIIVPIKRVQEAANAINNEFSTPN
ncbi:aspartate kinase [Candidatus Lokiarchaeum ossiferum]